MIAAAVAAGAAIAIVAQDRLALRNAPRDSAAQQAVLWQGDTLEIRAERMGYLQVWDPRRERAGWVLASAVRPTTLQPDAAPALLSVLRFLRDAPGAESLGIAYAAAYLKAAPAAAIDAEPFDALGVMAERLARQASARAGNETVSAHLDVASTYGVKFSSDDHGGTVRLCYDGDAFRRVLALAASAAPAGAATVVWPNAVVPVAMQVRAALAVTRADCIDPALSPLQRQQLDGWRAQVLDRLPAAAVATLSPTDRNRLAMRRAAVWSAVAFQAARGGRDAQPAGNRALAALAAVDQAELSDDDAVEYAEAAIRVGASRWSTESAPVSAGLRIVTRAGEPGQTCAQLLDGRPGTTPLAERCTWGVVWSASAAPSADGRALALAVQPLEAWRELWLFRLGDAGWTVDVLPPGSDEPDVGYAEFAGWAPTGHGQRRLLVTREWRASGVARRSFDVVAPETLVVERHANTPSLLALFGKWQDARWKSGTVSLR